MEKKMYTITEIKNAYGISRAFIMRLIRNGSLKATMIGNSWHIRVEDFEDYISTCQKSFDVEKVG